MHIEGRRSFGMTTGTVVLVAGTLGAAYMVSQALRNSIGVIAPDLAAELALSAAEIGVLSSASAQHRDDGRVFLSQAITGAIIELFPAPGGAYPLDAYRIVFAVQPLWLPRP